MNNSILQVNIQPDEINQFPALFEACKDAGIWGEVEEHLTDPIIAAAELIAKQGLPVCGIDRAARLATIGEMFLAHIHSAMEAEVADLPQ